MEVQIRNVQGEPVGVIELSDYVFGAPPHQPVLHQAVVMQLANRRAGTADTKTRAEVTGGGRKVWRQKGTGRARQGSIRAPHWRGGGVVFGPHPRSYRQRMPKKMRRLALRCALSSKFRDGRFVLLDHLSLSEPRTRSMLAVLQALGVDGKAMVVLPSGDEVVKQAARNIPGLMVATPGGVSLLEILKHDYLILTVEAAEAVQRWLGGRGAGEEVA